MPGTYPAGPPTLSGDLLTISRFLQSPTQIRRLLRSYQDLRFVSDQILTQRFRTSGGAASYELSEPFLTDRPVTGVAPGSVYPQANLPTGTAGLASVTKWGQKVPLTDEEIARSVYAGESISRNMRKVVNSVIAQVDGVTMSGVASAVTQSVAVGTGRAWDGSGANPPLFLRDILLAKAKVVKLNLGYKPDTLLLDDNHYAYLMADQTVTNALRRETTDNPIYTGEIEVLAGLTIVVSPSTVAVNPYVLDSRQLGGMADETDNAPGYAVADLAVETKAIRVDNADKWDLQGRRKTVPIVQEPGSACFITGTGT